ncbi:nitroreductase family protein [Lacticaseibacillus thailandensis]|uniref:Nitroreductase domain-containing protein n=1 Tax=Lacticaseibacillus thailandensis DSM 22698 = JCM 13996 TaxID=1423810 RepID=A0A0R2CF07_9LACO|nr:nitroreductase family protein [Lacticaseibacillus thailandensis]KRM86748.1 hypothetical protein FD19_GL001600 [Lacticaseibacillus thailandensis DSM 22698 = JCM 13996]
MEFYDVIKQRRTIRQFKNKPIAQDKLERILSAGLAAPSSNHQRQWQLVTVTDRDKLDAIAQIVKPYPDRIKEPKTPQQEMFKISYSRQRTMIKEAPCVILPYLRMKYDLTTSKNKWGLWDYGAGWALIENMLLAATAEGLGTGIHALVKQEPDQIQELVGAKDGYYLPALVILGEAADNAEIPTQVQTSIKKNVHWQQW